VIDTKSKKIKFVKSNCLGKVISNLYIPQIGIEDNDPKINTFIVPAPGVCYYELLYQCPLKENCPYLHFKKGDKPKDFIMETLEEECSICLTEILKNE